MAIQTRLTVKEGRKFGLTVGIAFLVLGSFAWWRGRQIVPMAAWALGGSLILGGLLVPTRMGPVQRAWMRMAHAMAKVTTPITMGILFFGIFTPVGLLLRALGRNPLAAKSGKTTWVSRGENRRSDLERQF